MKIAFIILAHKQPEQLNKFIDQLLMDAEIDIFIHVNKLCEDIIPKIKKDNRVIISKNNIPIYWGDDGILKAELLMMKEVLKTKNSYEYLFVCTGQDMLVRNGLNQFLQENRGKVFIERVDADKPEYINEYEKMRLIYKWPSIFRRQYDFRYHPFRILRHIYMILIEKRFPLPKKHIKYDIANMQFYKDWFWCALPVEIAGYITDKCEDAEFMKIYENAFIPEEGFITTLLMNSQYAQTVSYDNGSSIGLTYIKRMTDWHPLDLKIEDVGLIEESGKFLARKFDPNVDSSVIDYFYKKITIPDET